MTRDITLHMFEPGVANLQFCRICGRPKTYSGHGAIDTPSNPGINTDAGEELLETLRDRAAHVPGEMAMVSAIHSVEDASSLIPRIEAQARSEGYEYGLLHNEAPEIGAVARASRRAAIRRIQDRLHLDEGFGVDRDYLARVLDEEWAL